jgi:cobalt/nickel transport system permease protein
VRPDFLDRHSRLDSPVHRLPAGGKLAGALAVAVLTVSLPRDAWAAFAALGLVLALVAAASRIPPRFLAGRLLLLEPLALGVAGLAILQPGGGRIVLALLAKTTLCLATMLLLANTTPFDETLAVLRRLGVPALLVGTLALLYRYLFVLADEALRMRRARASRTFVERRWATWRGLGALIGQLFVRSTERAERIYLAMVARGWR